MKIKVYEKQWHNIPFNELDIELSLTQKADLNFYDKFYNVFFKRYKSYNELSKTWLEGKTEVAQLIEKNIQEKSKVLSYGCGIGFIEKYISPEILASECQQLQLHQLQRGHLCV